MGTLLIKNATLVNEGQQFESDVYVRDGRIFQIATHIQTLADETVDARGLHLFPGVIDDQVHFREPGLTHKADLYTEPRAAVAGGVTTFMEMPNTKPQTLTQELLQAKYDTAASKSIANYSFFMGASNDNLEEVLKTDPKTVCGIKVFMGSSTGNMLVDDEQVLDAIFRNAPILVATHCEKEEIIRANTAEYVAKYGDDIPIHFHPVIRSHEACLASSSLAVRLAQKHNTRLHILHISTAQETELFRNDIPLTEKRITSEVCIHHLWFDDSLYDTKGTHIKWNPAVKSAADRDALWKALLDDRLDIIATDHAPHTLDEKSNVYMKAPSGGPLVQHSLLAIMDFVKAEKISLERAIEKLCHAPAQCFAVKERGYLREGYWADLVLVDLNGKTPVTREGLFYKCGWSPFEGHTFQSAIRRTYVNGQLAFHDGQHDDSVRGMRVEFER